MLLRLFSQFVILYATPADPDQRPTSLKLVRVNGTLLPAEIIKVPE